MKKTILSIVLLLCAVLSVKAQDNGNITTAVAEQKPAATVGYFSYGNIITGIPDYAIAQQQIEELRVKYEAEAERVKKDFNDKYEAFLEGQKDFPPTILKKRQTELQAEGAEADQRPMASVGSALSPPWRSSKYSSPPAVPMASRSSSRQDQYGPRQDRL